MYFSTIAKRSILLVFLALIAFYCYGLGHLPLLGPDEPRYAQVAREMFLRGDLVTPTLGGRPWFEKPVLLYWLMMGSFKLFGISEFAARLPGALSGLFTIAALIFIGRALVRNVTKDPTQEVFGWWSTLIGATTIGTIVFSRAASFDIILTMTVTWALAFFICARISSSGVGLLKYFYAFVGLSLLAKGLIGIVIPFGVVVLYYLLLRERPRKSEWLSLTWGIPVVLLVAATWYLPVIWRHGWPFIDQFFIQHHFARYVSDKYHHWRPVYYYLQVVPLMAAPWTLFLFDGLARQLRRVLSKPVIGGSHTDRFRNLMTFAFAWVLFPLVFFSFSSSKLPGYILPVLPAIALLVGERVWDITQEKPPFVRGRGWPIRVTGLVCLGFGIGVLVSDYRTKMFPLTCVIVIAAMLLAAGFFALLTWRRRDVALLLIALATVGVLLVTLRCVAPVIADRESSKRLLQLADARGYSQSVVYGMQRSDRTPEFYAAGRVVYASDGEPIMYEAPWDVLQESLRRKAPVLAFVPLTELDRITQVTSAQIDVIGNNGRYAIVAVRAF